MVGVDLEDGPPPGDRLGDLVVPELLDAAIGVEVPGVAGARPRSVPRPGNGSVTAAEDLDDHSGRRRRRSTVTERWKLLSRTAPIGDAEATASSAATAACPSWLDASMSGTGSTDMRASLIVSLATSSSMSSVASTAASVDLPLAGAPDTMTIGDPVTGPRLARLR